MMEFDNLNGFLSEKGDKLFDTSSRALKYGDGVFETLKVAKGKVLFWDDHYKRLKKGIDYLKLDDIGKDKTFWEKELEKVIVKNYYREARIRLIVYRNSPGLYTPMGNRIGYLIEGMRYDNHNYTYDETGISLGVFKQDFKSTSPLSNLKTPSALFYVLAGIFKKEEGFDDVVVLNSKGNICETVSSNIFMVFNDKVITPALNEGCIDGVIRKQVLQILNQKNVDFEERGITIDELESADEIFTTNSIVGVQNIASFRGKKLHNIYAKQLQDYLDFLLR